MKLQPIRLRCEYHEHPVGVDVQRPRLSWELRGAGAGKGEGAGERQAAYQVQVFVDGPGDEEEETSAEPIWDTGRVQSVETYGIEYGGEPLQPHMRCRWRVRAWDADDVESAWSAWGRWSMGIWNPLDWNAKWVRSPVGLCPNAALFRKTLSIDINQVVDARLYATARGIFIASINGQRVGHEEFAPGWTDYRQKIHYRCYDVLSLLREGENVLGAVLNVGWYAGELGLSRMMGSYGKEPELLMMLRIELADGTVQTVGTDKSWRTSTSEVLESGFFLGEARDATLRREGWDSPGYDDAGWWEVWGGEEVKAQPRLAWHPAEPVRAVEVLDAVERWRVRPGSWIYDFGQNFAGRVRLTLPPGTPPGTTLRLRHGEMVNPDGTLYVENLRRATSIDTYTARGDTGGEVFEPVFTFHGFRYAELTGWPEAVLGEPPLGAMQGVVLTSDIPYDSTFECSHAMVNQLHRNIVWTQKGNFIDIPTDCPQRDERMGWTGDAQAFIRTALYNSDAAAFFTKWLADLNEAQHPDGRFPNVAPDLPHRLDKPLFHFGDAAWGDAGIICPIAIHDFYGDTRLLRQCYPHMQRWLAWQRDDSTHGLRDYIEGKYQVYGDWLNIDAPTDLSLIMSAFFGYGAKLMTQAANILGQQSDAAEYQSLYQTISDAFVSKYTHPDGRVAPPGSDTTTQTACLLALHFDLLPEARRDATLAQLLADLERHDYHLTTGFAGLPYLLPVLSRFGRSDAAYRLLLNTGFPSWGYSIEQGATTIWERWNGWLKGVGPANPSMNSFSHYAYGSVGEWLFSDAAGITPLTPGFARVRIRPRVAAPVGSTEPALTHVTATYHSIRGPIRVAWYIEDNVFHIEVDIPPNLDAELHMPTADTAAALKNLGSGTHCHECPLSLAAAARV